MLNTLLRLGLLFILLNLPLLYSFGQCDSLEIAANTQIGEKRIDALNEYARCFFGPDFRKMDSLTQLAFNEAKARDYKRGYARSIQNQGLLAYYYEQDDEKAFFLYQKARDSYREAGDSVGVAKTLGDIGSYYQGNGNYGLALSNYLKSLEILEKEKNKQGISTMSNNIGTIFVNTNENEEALFYLTKAIKSCDSIRDPINYGNMLGNVMVAWVSIENDDSVQHYFNKSVAFQQKIGTLNNLAETYSNMQSYYEGYQQPRVREFELRKMYVDSAFKYASISNYTPTIVQANFHKGLIFRYENQKDSSEKYFTKVVDLSSTADYESSDVYNSLRFLAEMYAKSGNYGKAYEFMHKADELGERLSQQKIDEALLKVKVQFQIEEVKKELELSHRMKALVETELEFTKLESQQKDELAKEKQIQLFLIGGGLLVSLAFVFIVYRAYRTKRKANEIINAQKEEVEAKRNEIEIQKQIAEEKKNELEDSIFYAQRIQQALMPDVSRIKETFPNSFIWYRPKEMVSGDFYWLKSIGEKKFFAVADCTGNGVPAALVSLVCTNSLNRAAEKSEGVTAGSLLTKTHILLASEFAKSSENVEDGMDIALCSIEGNVLSFAGANRPVWICRKGEVIEIEGAETSINARSQKIDFETQSIKLKSNDVVYLFTNGLIDQFGGEQGKKLKLSNLRRLLQAVHSYDCDKQRDMLQKAFEDWRGNMEQIDDICILGIKIE